jgi:hypothetical protein
MIDIRLKNDWALGIRFNAETMLTEIEVIGFGPTFELDYHMVGQLADACTRMDTEFMLAQDAEINRGLAAMGIKPEPASAEPADALEDDLSFVIDAFQPKDEAGMLVIYEDQITQEQRQAIRSILWPAGTNEEGD